MIHLIHTAAKRLRVHRMSKENTQEQPLIADCFTSGVIGKASK
jgi:hypothetical protein